MLKRTFLPLVLAAFTLALTGGEIIAQSTKTAVADKYVISARAGGINLVQGAVTVARGDGTGGSLMKGDRVEVGDKVSTAANSRAEILLNPGSFIRLDSNSEFEFISTGLDDLKVKLNRGTAMFEVFATDEFRVSVITPSGNADLIDSGIYRVQLRADGSASVAVTEGKAQLGTSRATIVKAGRIGTIGNSVSIAKFDRGKRDELAEWSRSRAKELAKVTASVKQRDIRDSLMSSFSNRGWGMYDSFGLWVFSPMYRSFFFLPFGNRWYSPYGFGFGYGMDWGRIPWWNTGYVYTNRGNTTTPSTGGGTTQRPAKIGSRGGSRTRPPYTTVERKRAPVGVESSGGWMNTQQRSVQAPSSVFSPPSSSSSPLITGSSNGGRGGVKPID